MLFIQDKELIIRPINESDIETVFEVYRECEDFLALRPEPKASLTMVKADMDLSDEAPGILSSKEKNRGMITDFKRRTKGAQDE